jgi:hypothetical protein
VRDKLPNSPELPQRGGYEAFVPRFYTLWRMLKNWADDIQTQITNITVGGAVADGDKGDITVSSSGTVWTIDADAVTYAKIQDVAANSYLGRAASSDGNVSAVGIGSSQLAGRGSSGDLSAITLGTGLSMSGTTLNASVAAASPPDVPGLAAWYEADSLAVRYGDGAQVLLWENKVSHPHFENLLGTVTNGPEFKTNIVNGHHIVRFDGTHWMKAPNYRSSSVGAIGALTIIGIVNPDNASTGLLYAGRMATNNYEWDVRVPNTTAAIAMYQQFGANHASVAYGSNPSAATWYMCTHRMQRIEQIAAWRNGGTGVTSTSFTSVQHIGTAELTIGERGDGSVFLDGDLAEVLIYTRALLTSELDLLGAYFATKYGLTIAAHT